MLGNICDRSKFNTCSIGGPQLKSIGSDLIFDLTPYAVVGLVEVLKNYNFFKSLLEETITWIKEHRPKCICLIDYPGFNLRLAKRLADEGLSQKGGGGIKIIYYIAPQVWAWKAKRRFEMAKTLNSLGVIFPFETACFKDTSLPTSFVGHPFVQETSKSNLNYKNNNTILLLPGSREQPVRRILPTLLSTFSTINKTHPSYTAVIISSDDHIKEVILKELLKFPKELQNKISIEESSSKVNASFSLTSSGTMSLTCALAGIPGYIVYKAHPLTYLIGRSIVNISYIGIANLLLNKEMYLEFIQNTAKPSAILNEFNKDLRFGTEEMRRIALREADKLKALLSTEKENNASSWLLEHIG